MDASQIVLLIVVILLVLALIAWALTRRQASAKKEAQAREHLTEARERQARAESARAAADEKAAQLRRERAELEQRAAQQEREAAQLAQDADRDQARAAELQQRAHKLAPHLADDDSRVAQGGTPASGYDGYADTRGFDAHREGIDARDAGPAGNGPGYDGNHDVDYDGGQADRDPATAYRHSAPVTDPDAGPDGRQGNDGTYADDG